MTETQLPVITGVVIMVPEAKAIVPSAHITLLAPFGEDMVPTDGELADLEEFFAEQVAFDFALTGVSQFPQGVRYLAPEPAARFTRLTHGLQRVFPEYPPYRGSFDLVVPHLTIPDDALVEGLPIRSQAREASVLHYADGTFTELASFPFGTSAA